MEKINGSQIQNSTDMYGYEIDPNKDYVIDHINCWGCPEYVTVEAWENSHIEVNTSIFTDEDHRKQAYQNGVLLFLGRQDWMTDEDWEYFQKTNGNPK